MAAGTVSAAIRIWRNEIDNAFVFTGYGDHHAGGNFLGGGCYFNGTTIAIHELRRHFGVKKATIIDTDAHHGNGTWEILEDDPEVLYVCLCSGRLIVVLCGGSRRNLAHYLIPRVIQVLAGISPPV